MAWFDLCMMRLLLTVLTFVELKKGMNKLSHSTGKENDFPNVSRKSKFIRRKIEGEAYSRRNLGPITRR